MIRRLFKEMIILATAFAAGVYMIFPTLGIFELIPDAIPIIGSLDEGAATLILLNTLSYYGLDITRLYGKRQPSKKYKRRRRKPNRSEQINQPPVDIETEHDPTQHQP